KDPYPLSDMKEALQALSTSSYFSHLDIEGAYEQIPVLPQDVEKTAFATKNGMYEFLYVPFGLNRSSGALARNLDKVFVGLKPSRVINFSDDIIAHGKNREQAYKSLEDVMNALASAGLLINLAKCRFITDTIEFL